MPSPAANRLTRSHQADLAAVGALVAQDVRRIARTAAPANIDAWWVRALDDLLALVAAAFAGTRTLGVRYLEQHAALEGRTVEPVRADWSTRQVETSLRVTGPVEWKRHFGRTGDEAGATRAMAATLAGAAQRLALEGGRGTTRRTVQRAPAIVGWRRVTDVDPCAFCALLASRGAVYKTAATAGAGLQWHDHDQCTVEPLYEREAEPPEVERIYALWQQVTAGHSGAAAVREWRRWWDQHRAEVT